MYKRQVAGALVGGSSSYLASMYFKGTENSLVKTIIVGSLASLSSGLLKEVYDVRQGNKADPMDVVYTTVSGVALSMSFTF